MVFDSMFVYHFVDFHLRVETFHANVQKKFNVNFKKMSTFLLFFFWWQKIAFKSSLDLYLHPSIIEFRVEEKIHTKAVVDVSRGDGGRIFLGEIREGVSRNLLPPIKLYQRIWKWNLDQNLIMALPIVAVCTVLF